METEYEIKLKADLGEIKVISYQDDTGYSKSTQPATDQDFEVVESLKGLMKKLNLCELKVELKKK